MNSKIVKLLALIAVLFGSALGSGIQLQVFPASNQHWLAVDPLNDSGATAMVEVMEASGSWVAMKADEGWGYFAHQNTQGSGFAFPLSFRLTDADGNQVVINHAMSSVVAGATIDTDVNFGGAVHVRSVAPATPSCGATNPTNPPTSAPVTQAPTTKPSSSGSSSGNHGHGHGNHGSSSGNHGSSSGNQGSSSSGNSGSATSAPTTEPTSAPTTKPTSAPTTRPGNSGSATSAPTTRPGNSGSATSAPTTKPTSAPTTKPTTAPSTSGSSSTDLCAVTPTSSEPLKILVPLYVAPGSAWDQLVTAANAGAKIIAIINPNSGPGSGPDSSYKTYMQKLTAAGIDMVGYVHTSYGARSISDVQNDINVYATKFTGLKGIFIDEASADKSELSYYQQVYSAITSKSGFSNVILNPGTQPDQGYLNVATNIVIFESPASSLKSSFASWVKCAPNASEKAGYKYKFSGIAYGASQSTMASTITTMKNAGMGMVYVTDGASGCCTYNTLASYFVAEASAVKSA